MGNVHGSSMARGKGVVDFLLVLIINVNLTFFASSHC